MLDQVKISIASNALPSFTFDDPNFVRSYAIIVNTSDGSLHAVLHETDVHLGTLDAKTMRELYAHEHVTLTARRPDGTIVTIHTPLKICNA